MFIKEIKTGKFSKDDAIYMMKFNEKEISKSQSLQIRYLCDVRFFLEKSHSVQIVLCMDMELIFIWQLKNVCPTCSGSNDFSKFIVRKVNFDGPKIFKCYNCIKKDLKNIYHIVDDTKFPCRADYLELTQNLTEKK